MERQVGQRDVVRVEVVGQLRQLLAQQIQEDALVHTHAHLVRRREEGVPIRR